MTKSEQSRIVAWRLKLLREASVMPPTDPLIYRFNNSSWSMDLPGKR